MKSSQSHEGIPRSSEAGRECSSSQKVQLRSHDIQAWLVLKVCEIAKLDREQIDPARPFVSYGLSSKDAVGLSGELEELLGTPLSPTLVYEYPTIETLASYLAGEPRLEESAIENARDRVPEREPIAIIGIGCRFPGAQGPAAFWRLLRDGVDAVSEIPADRWNVADFQNADCATAGKTLTKWGGFLEHADHFDPEFFKISPREAERMDPQQRILLEVAWEAIEDAALVAESLNGTQTGVFVGVSTSDYSSLQSSDPSLIDAYSGTGNARSIIANRLSYFFDFHGPSIAVDTACSSSLVAIHLACQSLINGECTLALAGGVNLIFSPEINIIFSRAGLLAADGRCKVFDEKADGYVRGEGAGLVILKGLSRALADGDPIYAVIKGSAVNQDGRTNGISAPNGRAQERVLRAAYRQAGVSPEQVQYVEAHGAGTLLGDQIEAKSLGAVLAQGRTRAQPCALGSVKSNIGHLEAAAGVAGLIKTALALKHRQLPASLHFEEPNPLISFASLSLQVQRNLESWPFAAHLPLAGVSAFGFGGTNCHVVLEGIDRSVSAAKTRQPQLLLLSARIETGLDHANAKMVDYLKQDHNVSLSDVSHTLRVGRSHFKYRQAMVCGNVEDAVSAMDTRDAAKVFRGVRAERRPLVTFMFAGVGDEYVGMAAELYQNEPVFRRSFDQCCDLLVPHLNQDLRDIIFAPGNPTPSVSRNAGIDLRQLLRGRSSPAATDPELRRTLISQPALFVTAYALAQLLLSWGLQPDGMIGYSVGEYVAACLAGVIQLDDALVVVAKRAQLIDGMPAGAMLAVILSKTEVQELLGPNLFLAADNGGAGSVLAGTPAAIEALEAELKKRETPCQRIQTERAFHSPMMLPLYSQMAELMQAVKLSPPQISYLSNVTGQWIRPEEATDPHYWARHLCQTVRFGEGLGQLLEGPDRIFLEVGPGQTLAGIVKQHAKYQGDEQLVMPTLPAPHLQQSDLAFLFKVVGKLWLRGVEVDWTKFGDKTSRRLSLPTYAFEGGSYWIEGSKKPWIPAGQSLVGKKPDRADWFYVPTWTETLLPRTKTPEVISQRDNTWVVFLDDCGVGEAIVERLRSIPGAGAAVVTVKNGARYRRLDDRSFIINPAQPDDYQSLVKELAESGQLPTEIIHFWSLTPAVDLTFDECQNLGFYSLIFLARAIGDFGNMKPLRLKVVSNNIHEVGGEEEISPEKSTLLGVCRVISQEYSNIVCRSIDILRPRNSPAREEQLIDKLFTELTAGAPDLTVAYRGNRRWIQSFAPVRIGQADETSTRLREGGVYLITGGLGEMGLAFAEAIARQSSAKLVLTSRLGLPERKDWELWLEGHDEHEAQSSRIRKIKELEQLGAEILVLRADVADEPRMVEVIAETIEAFGDLHGVIHAAGLISTDSFALIRDLDRKKCEPHFRAKVQGLVVLEKVLRSRDIDFYLLLSSLSCYLGGLGFAPYAAANIFMDTFARKQNQITAVPWLCVNWEAWQAREKELLKNLVPGGWEATGAQFQVTAEEGTDVFLRVLSANTFTHLVNSTGDFQTRVDRWSNPKSSPGDKNPGIATPSAGHRWRRSGTVYVGPGNELERTMTSLWQRLLGIAQVGIHDNFFELGGDSILGLQFVAAVNQAGFRLNPKQVLTHPTIAELAIEIGRAELEKTKEENFVSHLPPTPFQRWFLERESLHLHSWARTVLLEIRQPLDPGLLREAVRHLLARHDALRLRFVREDEGFRQAGQELDQDTPFTQVDLSGLSTQDQTRVIDEAFAELQPRLNLWNGPVMMATHFDRGQGRAASLLLVVHHLVADRVSWQILLADLEAICRSLFAGALVDLGPKTTSFRDWSQSLVEQSGSAELPHELDFWLDESRSKLLPLAVDFEEGRNLEASARSVLVQFSLEETTSLLHAVSKAYRATVEEVLLTCLAQAFARWTKAPAVLIAQETTVRKSVTDEIELSRTIGCFRHVFPTVLDLGGAENAGDALTSIKECLRRIPHQGSNYGLLYYSEGDTAPGKSLRAQPRPEVSFRYTPGFEQIRSASSWFHQSAQSDGTNDEQENRRYLLEVRAAVVGERLEMSWTYSENIHARSKVEDLANDFSQALRVFIAQCRSPESKPCLPSDFPLAKLDARKLSKVVALIEKVERSQTSSQSGL